MCVKIILKKKIKVDHTTELEESVDFLEAPETYFLVL